MNERLLFYKIAKLSLKTEAKRNVKKKPSLEPLKNILRTDKPMPMCETNIHTYQVKKKLIKKKKLGDLYSAYPALSGGSRC
jgi:hypothetical protein